MRFYSSKQVYLTLGIHLVTLYKRIKLGYYPPLESDGGRKGTAKGYFEDTLERVKGIQTPSNGRPKNV